MIYGMYYCLNLVTEAQGVPHAILIRALQPLSGLDEIKPDQPLLMAGPGRLCRAFGIDRRYYGHPLWRPPLYLARTLTPWPPYQIARGPRINIAYAGEASQYPWRFWVYKNPSVSKPQGPLTSLEEASPG
jgi:DNA-3-methyladenine glycosylase